MNFQLPMPTNVSISPLIKAVIISSLIMPCGPVLAKDIGQIDRLTEKWLAIDRQSTQLHLDWQIQKPILTQRLSLLKAERTQLQELLKESSESQEGVAARRKELIDEQTTLETQQQGMLRYLDLLTKRIQSLQGLLPPPLMNEWLNGLGALSRDSDASQRLNVVISLLSKLVDFDQRISLHQAPIELPDGKEIMVKQLYLGIGMAWFTSAEGQYSGWGQTGENGWGWNLDNDIDSKEVKKAIAIFEKTQTASFVRLPVKLVNKLRVQGQ